MFARPQARLATLLATTQDGDVVHSPRRERGALWRPTFAGARGRTMKTVDINYVAIGVLWLVAGMLLGIGMGAANNFVLAPLHAHINLIGFVCHAVFGTTYRHWPALKESALAPYQFWVFVVATPITLLGLYFTVTGGPALPTIVGSIAVLVGAALFAAMIWNERQKA
jgi:hypothetical protein